jgi:death-on-curing protein
MDPINFLNWDELLELHRSELQAHGGQDGFISEGVVRSVLSRAQFTAQYNPDADIADMAADYMYGFATTQGFMDGNKRTALAATSTFIRKNGFVFVITNKLMYLVAIAVAKGELDRDSLAEILRDHMQPIDDDTPG